VPDPLRTPARSLAVVILTLNEEVNLPHALSAIAGWCDEMFVLDSFSEDRTVEIARRFGCHVEQRAFVDYATQRNYALDSLPIASEWVLFLDADEWLPEALKAEISGRIASRPIENGFYIKRRLIWMGTWIRRGYYPTWILRLFRRGTGRCEDRAINEHLIVSGSTGRLHQDFVHEDRKDVSDWIAKHNGYAGREAAELRKGASNVRQDEIAASLFGGQASRKRWLRRHVWQRLPPLVRPFLYFFYRYVLAGGFLDGRGGLSYHFLHALWYPMLIDIRFLEDRRGQPAPVPVVDS
jgi:glycosyltransferase involved in cell wall biosynthesis